MSSSHRNRSRSICPTGQGIPYFKELRNIAGSIPATLLMQQLEYWFVRYPDGFYKYLEPAKTAPLYRPGKSWSEELGFTRDEFRAAFDRIGHRWASKTAFDTAKDKFCGKLYTSYVDRRTNLTWYIRNHQQIDQTLQSLWATQQHIDKPDVYDMGNSEVYDIDKSNVRESEIPLSGPRKIPDPDREKPEHPYTENTTEITKTTTTRLPADSGNGESGSGRSLKIHFPKNLSPQDRTHILNLISPLDIETGQNIIDEIAGIQQKGQIRHSVISLAAGLVRKAGDGSFTPALATGIAEARKREQQLLSKQRPAEPAEDTGQTPASAETARKTIAEIQSFLRSPPAPPYTLADP